MQVHRTANQVVPRFRCRSEFTSVCMEGLDAVGMSAAAALYYTLCHRLLVDSVPSVATGRASAHATPVQLHHLCREDHSANLVGQRRLPAWRRERGFAARLEECAPRLPACPTCLCGLCNGGQRQPAPESIVSPRETLGRRGEMARGSQQHHRFAHCSARRKRCCRRHLDSSSAIGAVASATPCLAAGTTVDSLARQARNFQRLPARKSASTSRKQLGRRVANGQSAGGVHQSLSLRLNLRSEKRPIESEQRPTFWAGRDGKAQTQTFGTLQPLQPRPCGRQKESGRPLLDRLISSFTPSTTLAWPGSRLSLQLHPLMKIANTSHTSARQAGVCVSSTCAHDTGACIHVAVLQTSTATQQERCDHVMGTTLSRAHA